jgi:hypothetical protein
MIGVGLLCCKPDLVVYMMSLRGFLQASSSIGRAAVSKTAGWGFDSLLACHITRSGRFDLSAALV